jgi:hypothetical protein
VVLGCERVDIPGITPVAGAFPGRRGLHLNLTLLGIALLSLYRAKCESLNHGAIMDFYKIIRASIGVDVSALGGLAKPVLII